MAMNAASSVSSSYAQAQADRMQGDYRKQVADINSKFADISYKDAIDRGESAVRINQQRTRSMVGAQRSSFAAQGIDVNKGSAADVQESTAGMSALDNMTIRQNAMREAMGYKVQALNYSMEGQFASMSARNSANNTLLTGGMNALRYGTQGAYWYMRGDKPVSDADGSEN